MLCFKWMSKLVPYCIPKRKRMFYIFFIYSSVISTHSISVKQKLIASKTNKRVYQYSSVIYFRRIFIKNLHSTHFTDELNTWFLWILVQTEAFFVGRSFVDRGVETNWGNWEDTSPTEKTVTNLPACLPTKCHCIGPQIIVKTEFMFYDKNQRRCQKRYRLRKEIMGYCTVNEFLCVLN